MPHIHFTYAPAMPREAGVTRRDPSPVIRVDGLYYVWYSRTTTSFDGYSASVWYATSPDGHIWEEQGEALPKGAVGTFDEHAVFTPTIMASGEHFYLFYTAVPEPFTNDKGGVNGTRTAIGLAIAKHPRGPWQRFAGNPVLRPGDDPTDFDSMRVDDTCLVVKDKRFYMYYKGRQQRHTPGETKMGLAIADNPTGPYRKVAENPVVNGGHEVCCWPHGRGVAALFCNIGPVGNTCQYSDDGIHFTEVAKCKPPQAPGPFREDHWQDGQGPGLSWGVAMEMTGWDDWPYLVRFDCQITPETTGVGQ